MNEFSSRDLMQPRNLRSLKKGFNAWAGKRSSVNEETADLKENNVLNQRLSKLLDLVEWKIERSPSRNSKVFQVLKKRASMIN